MDLFIKVVLFHFKSYDIGDKMAFYDMKFHKVGAGAQFGKALFITLKCGLNVKEVHLCHEK